MSESGLRPGTLPGFADSSMEAFEEAAREMGFPVTPEDRDAVYKWLLFYCRWPGRRVIGFTDPKDVAVKLLADSYAVRCLDEVRIPGPAIDLGSGNGWPGLVFCPQGQVFLLDSRKGACDFMRGLADYSGMVNVRVIEARAEEAGRAPSLEGRFGIVCTRAMASPGMAVEAAAPFLRAGGVAVLWLGPAQEEAVVAHADIREVGLTLAGLRRYDLPGGMGHRVLAAYRRTGKSLPGFPRKIVAVRAKPLF